MNHAPLNQSKHTMIALLAIATTCPFVQGGDNSGYLVPATAAGTSMVGPAAVFSDQSSITQRELARRKDRTRQAMILLEEGRQAYRDKKYKLALDKYNEALSMLPNAPATEPQRNFIIESIGDASVATAIEYSRIGRYDEAEQLLLDTLRNNPNNKRARQELSMLRDPVRNNPALTPEHVKNVEEVNRLLTLAYGYYNLGQFNQAYDEFNRVLLIDPYNEAARRGQEAVSKRQLKYYETAHDTFRARAIAEVEAMWEPTVPVNAPRVATITEDTTQISAQQAEIIEKLNTLPISSVNFEDTSIEDALGFLRGEFRKSGQSLNIIFERPIAQVATPASSSSDEESDDEEDASEEDSAPTPAPVATPRESIIAKLELQNVTAKELLDRMVAQAGCQYNIEDNAIVVYPSGAGNEKMFRRQYKVNREFFAGGEDGDDSMSSDGDEFLPETSAPKRSGRINAKVALSSMGVAFPPGATANYSVPRGTLTVYNTLENLEWVEEAVAESRRSLPQMIKLSTKFVEVSQTNTDELSFDWIINPFSVNDAGDTFLGGGGNAATDNMVTAPQNYNGINRWPNGIGQATGGLRSGNNAVTGSVLDQLLATGSTTAATTSTPAPGILSLTGIYDDGAYQMIMRGLSQKKGVDIMSAPSLLARPGAMPWTPPPPSGLADDYDDDECAKIEVVRRFIYPVAYDPPQLSEPPRGDNSLGLPIAAPSNPAEWATEEVGIVLRFRVADGEGDSDIIKFEHFEIKVVDFEGFINYGSPIMAGVPSGVNYGDDDVTSGGEVAQVLLTENRIEMPIFQRRFINTNPCIYDGHTIAIGGLISESVQKVEDKVPVFGDLPLVGRFFRSNVESHIKKNLMVFATAEKVDPTGRPTRERETGTPVGNSSSPSLFPDEGLVPQP